MTYLAVLGRQPLISVAELESQFSDVQLIAENLALFQTNSKPGIDRLGGTIKLAQELPPKFAKNPADFLLDYAKTANFTGKFVLGISDYSPRTNPFTAQKEGLHLKRILKKHGHAVRILPNKTAALSSATVFHNQLGEKPGHFELIKFKNRWFLGIGVQNINAYTARDQARPARDAKNGMLPPKLAQILINLCGPLPENARILDPFCGTGTVLQETLLMGYRAYGTDANERMIEHARRNLDWLDLQATLSTADATSFTWQPPIDAVACEGYLGPPMSQPPVEIKLKTAQQDCKAVIIGFLKNLSSQIQPKTPIAMAIPAWLRPDGSYQRLNLLDEITELGYNVVKYKNLRQEDLLYFRDGQIVAREIIVLRKK